MAKNDERRRDLADAGLRVMAQLGGRGLTHRAVDREADVPIGTTSNYFASRNDLVDGLITRIGERIQPDPVRLARLEGAPPTRQLFADYLRDIVARLTADPDVTIALFEFRLEASRNPDVAARIGAWQRDGFAADVAFNTGAGFPGGPHEIALFHYAIDGLLLDRLTAPIDPGTPTDEVIWSLVEGLLPPIDS